MHRNDHLFLKLWVVPFWHSRKKITLHRHEVRTHIAAFQRASTTFYECNDLTL
jgi:hypothetical protein